MKTDDIIYAVVIQCMNNGKIDKIIELMEQYRGVSWEQMPDIELYMDQVITYLKRQLEFFHDSPEDNLITPSIINNYVKNGIAPRPTKKKYARAQLAALTMACVLKRIMPIERVKELIRSKGQIVDQTFFDEFCDMQNQILKEEAKILGERLNEECKREDMLRLALEFSLRANANRLVAGKILDLVGDEANRQNL